MRPPHTFCGVFRVYFFLLQVVTLRFYCHIISNDTFNDWKMKDSWIAENIDRIRIPFMIEGDKVTFSGIEKLFQDKTGKE